MIKVILTTLISFSAYAYEPPTTYTTYKNPYSNNTTTYGSDGTSYNTYKNPYSDTTTTYGSDGSTATTYKNPYSDTTTTTVTPPTTNIYNSYGGY